MNNDHGIGELHTHEENMQSSNVVVHGSDSVPKRAVDKDSRNIPFKDPKQVYVALQMAHQNLKCRSKTAAFQILGSFKTQQLAKAHLEKLESTLESYTTMMHCWTLIPKKLPETQEEAQKMQVRTVKKVEDYISSCKKSNDKIVEQTSDEKAEERYEETMNLSKIKEKLEADLETDNTEDNSDQFVIPRNGEVRGQNWAAVSIICDPNIDEEPAINVLRTFESQEMADDYVRNTLLLENIVTDAFVVRMYEWVSPLLIHTKKFYQEVKASYSYTQLENLHKGQVQEQNTIRKILEAQGKTEDDVVREVAERLEGEPSET